MIVCCRLFLCLNLMPPGVSGVLLKIMLSCDTCCIYLSLCVFTVCVLANKGVHKHIVTVIAICDKCGMQSDIRFSPHKRWLQIIIIIIIIIIIFIQRAAQTVLGVYLKRTCSCVTNASSALAVLTIMRYTNPQTHSLTIATCVLHSVISVPVSMAYMHADTDMFVTLLRSPAGD